MPTQVALDLPMCNKLVNGVTKNKRWTNGEEAAPKLALRPQMIKHRKSIRIVIVFREIVAQDKDDVNIVRLRLRGHVAAEDNEAQQFAGGLREIKDAHESDGRALAVRRAVTEARQHFGERCAIDAFGQFSVKIKLRQRHSLFSTQRQH